MTEAGHPREDFGGGFPSELEAAIRRDIEITNGQPKPFVCHRWRHRQRLPDVLEL